MRIQQSTRARIARIYTAIWIVLALWMTFFGDLPASYTPACRASCAQENS